MATKSTKTNALRDARGEREPAPQRRRQLPLPFPTEQVALPFVHGTSNADALSLLDAWFARTGDDGGMTSAVLALTGPRFAGKSRLLREVVSERNGALVHPDAKGRLTVVAEEGRTLIGIDNAHIASSASLVAAFNRAVNENVPTIMTGEGRPEHWGRGPNGEQTPLPDLLSRLATTPVAALDAPSEQMLLEASSAALEALGLLLPPQALRKTVSKLKRRFDAVEQFVDAVRVEAASGGTTGRGLLTAVMRDIPTLFL